MKTNEEKLVLKDENDGKIGPSVHAFYISSFLNNFKEQNFTTFL